MEQRHVDFSQIDKLSNWNKKGVFNGMQKHEWEKFKNHILKVVTVEGFPYKASKLYHFMKSGQGYSGNIRFNKDNLRAYGPVDLGPSKTITLLEAGDKKYIVNSIKTAYAIKYKEFISLNISQFNNIFSYYDKHQSLIDELKFPSESSEVDEDPDDDDLLQLRRGAYLSLLAISS
jgi:hypothetical protein